MSAIAAAPEEWLRVSPKYVWVELVSTLVPAVIVTVGSVVATFVTGVPWLWIIGAAAIVVAIVLCSLAPRRVRSIGYCLRADDLVFRRGIMWHRVVAVPYGRMQLVDVTRGPVARALGLAELKFVTAAVTTAVTIPGLPESDAEALRDQLVALAEARRAAL